MFKPLLIFGFFLVTVGCGSAALADDQNMASPPADKAPENAPSDQSSDAVLEDWSLHAQATEIYQGYPTFSAPYSGTNSLPTQGQWKNTTTATLFLGRRLWDGAAVYYDPELYQGVALNHTLGIAGFPNGEGSKSGSYDIEEGTARLFMRQVIGFGGPTEKIEPDQNQLADVEDVSRLTITGGIFAATDIFDDNSYSHDPRTQFLNWSLMDSAAWDYPADARGYTNGVALELNQEDWALRYGLFMEPRNPNESDLAFRGLDNEGQVVELEERYNLGDDPGKTRFLVFYNRNRAGNFDDALNQPGNITTDLINDRHYGSSKYGAALNMEQQLNNSLGAFARLSWNNGQTEDWTFTQVDESAALGISLKGADWGRPDDVVGLAGVVNGISSEQQKYLERGGLGLIIGDGQLNYAPEAILEAYYDIKIIEFVSLSPDYQLIANPAYNSDRGPVNIFAVRLHAEY